MEISDKVRKLRDHLELSMESFGEILGVSKQTVSNWENAKREPTKKMRESLNELAKQFNVKLNFTDNDLKTVSYKTCLNCKYEKVEQEFSFCPMCGQSFDEIDLEKCEEILLEYYHIDELIKAAEEQAMYPDNDPNKFRNNIVFEPITNKEEMKAIGYAQRSGKVRRLERIKKIVPLALDELVGLEKEVISYLYCTGNGKKKPYSKVIKITGLDLFFIQKTDLKAQNLVGEKILY